MSLQLLFSIGFACFVVTLWIRQHFFVLQGNWLLSSFPLIVLGILASLAMSWRSRHHSPLTLHFRRITVFGMLFLCTLVILNIQTFFSGFLPGHTTLIPYDRWLSTNLALSFKLGIIFMLFGLLTIFFVSLGRWVLKFFGRYTHDPSGYYFFLSLAIGIWVSSVLLLALGSTSYLTAMVLMTVIIGFSLLQWRTVVSLARWCWESDTWSIDLRKSVTFIAILGFFLVSLIMAQTLRPEPSGYDDMTYYMDRVQQISETQQLVTGGQPFPFELLAAAIDIIGRTHHNHHMLALSFGVYGLFLGVLVTYALGKDVFRHSVGLLAGLIMLSIPMATAISILEVKPDSLLFPITTIFFWSLIRWLRTNETHTLYMTGFLLGFAVTIKLTALFLVVPLVSALVWSLWRHAESHHRRMRTFLFTGIFVLVPLSPWFVLGEVTRPSDHPRSLTELVANYTHEVPSLSRDIQSQLQDTACLSTAASEEYLRFASDRSVLGSFALWPWDMTMNLRVTSYATEIGFLFLAILPFGIVLARRWRSIEVSTAQTSLIALTLFTFGYWITWAALAERITWYGYPGLVLLAILVAYVIDQMQHISLWSYRFLIILFSIGLMSHSLLLLRVSGSPVQLRFAADAVTADDYLDKLFPGLITLQSAFERPSKPRVYLAGSPRIWYAINHHERGFSDAHLDTFQCLLETYGATGLLDQFRTLDIQYVLFSRSLLRTLQSEDNPTLRKKVESFTNFSGHSFDVIWGSPDYMLFEVPQKSSPIPLPSSDSL